jgi:branched-chain amino acid transport system substrate-binding protein
MSWKRGAKGMCAATAALALAVGVAACGDDEDSASGGGAGGATTTQATTASLACGAGTGKKATGDPIKLGAIVTKQPGLDFSGSATGAKAYFDCVNDNGGIDGRPIQYTAEEDQTNPQQVASFATKLLDDGTLAMVGSSSILDCEVNAKQYASRGVVSLAIGASRGCFFNPDIAPVNQGPYYSTLAMANYLLGDGAKSIVAVVGKAPGSAFQNQGAVELAKQKGVPGKSVLEELPISDASSVALKLSQEAGDGGGVVIDLGAPEAIKILKAAEQQGLQDKVKWACAGGCYDAFVAKALGPAWEGKLPVAAELNLLDGDGADAKEYLAVTQQYSKGAQPGVFGQLGYLTAKIATKGLLDAKLSEYTPESVSKALRDVKGFQSDLLCKPWYFGDGEAHLANDATRVMVPEGGRFVVKKDCTDIPAVPSNPLADIRKAEDAS